MRSSVWGRGFGGGWGACPGIAGLDTGPGGGEGVGGRGVDPGSAVVDGWRARFLLITLPAIEKCIITVRNI